ncbi:cytochrome P450 [Karstenula rhodostoma CBS 690.94]|uniref:Cytochrome P450 n=1 Tax=Karstenula rhodostoma CBS 690.94 TaxID=1392251 RepID=A0A9P4U7S9_9PLEO|nr:cytochrome P450 [Karstenula rhodostoma CBS 690.94]
MLSPMLIILLAIAAFSLRSIIRGIRSPLAHVPGPWHTRFTNLSLRIATISGRRIHHVDSLHQKYGPIIRLSPTQLDVSELSSFSQIHRIGSHFHKSPWYEGTHRGRKPGVFAMQDPSQHAQRRRLFARAFSYTSISTHWETVIREKVSLAVHRIREASIEGGRDQSLVVNDSSNVKPRNGADILKWWTLMATDVIAHLAFGESFQMLELGQQTTYIDALQSANMSSVLRSEAPLVWHLANWIPFGKLHAITQAEKVVMEYGTKAIQNMRRQGGGMKNLFGQMEAAAEKDDGGITDDEVKTEAGNLIIAGSDTTAVTLTYLVWAVLKQPALQKEVEVEVAGLSDALHLEELIKNMPLLNSVIEETLRLYGAAPGALPRSVPKEGAVFGGYQIPGGAEVSTQAYTIHRHSDVWNDPWSFNGYRFLDKSTMSSAQKTAMHPFGTGSRSCIGLHLAWIELRLGAAIFFRHCRGAQLAPCMTDEMMEIDNRFLISPKGHCCFVVL